MFEWFKEAVIADYKRKKNEPSFGIVKPTPALLRDEFLRLLSSRRNADDIKVLRRFLDMNDDEQDLERRLGESDIDKFRPLQNYMQGETRNPGENIVKLLAWLIDFQPRPYHDKLSRKDLGLDQEENDPPAATSREDLGEQEIKTIPEKEQTEISGSGQLPRVKLPRLTRSFALYAFIAACIVVIYKMVPRDKQCMYWNDFEYIAVDCNDGISDMAVPLNQRELQYQKFIRCPDTITERHIGKVWYIKTNKQVELFTIGGQYPNDRNRRLNKLSPHIFKTYVRTKKVRGNCPG